MHAPRTCQPGASIFLRGRPTLPRGDFCHTIKAHPIIEEPLVAAPPDRIETESDPSGARAADDSAETAERPEVPDDPSLDTALTIEQPALPEDPGLEAAETIERPAIPDDPELDTAATGPLPSLAPPSDEHRHDDEGPLEEAVGALDALPLPPLSAPSVMVDGPSEAHASPTADRCPYCLTFIGLGAARRRGVRFCPLCGADWQTIGKLVEVPTGAVIPFDETDAPLPIGPGDDDDFPTSQFTRPPATTRPAPAVESAPPPSRPSPWLMLAVGVLAGLAGTVAFAQWWRSDRAPTPPTTDTVATATPVEPTPSAPVAPTPVEPPPVEPPAPLPVEPPPVEPPPAEPIAEPPDEPLVNTLAVQATLIDTASLMPPSDMVDVRARVEGDIVFLDGHIGNTEALGRLVTSIAAVDGVRAVDSRGVRPSSRTHVVAIGDTLAKIARLYYQDATAWPRIYEANGEIIERPDTLVPGMRLKIPSNEGR